jgi:hypothetical protein
MVQRALALPGTETQTENRGRQGGAKARQAKPSQSLAKPEEEGQWETEMNIRSQLGQRTPGFPGCSTAGYQSSHSCTEIATSNFFFFLVY